MEWLKKMKSFLESDSFSVNKTAAVGYLMKVHLQYTNCVTLKTLLLTTLEDIMIDPQLALELDPMLQEQQTTAKTNGDMFITTIPPFEVYKTQTSHGSNKEKVETEVIRNQMHCPASLTLEGILFPTCLSSWI